jgi:hypothetical protein
MRCVGCNREIEIGDSYIEDTASGFMSALGTETDASEIDGLVAELLGGTNGKVVYCEDCTQEGGNYKFETFYGDVP